MALPSNVNTREKNKFEALNGDLVAVRTIDRGNIVAQITKSGLLTGVTYNIITATAVNSTTIDYKYYNGASLSATVRFVYISEASWSLTKS